MVNAILDEPRDSGMRVMLLDPFWGAWRSAVLDRGLAHQWAQCERTGRLENFRRVAEGRDEPHEGRYYDDSDVYKLLEACAYAFGLEPGHPLRPKVEEFIEVLERAQAPDGYINTFVQLGRPDQRWRNLSDKHEMYCLGHLIEAGVAYWEATGDDRLLRVARKAADHVESVFGPGLRKGYCGHEEIELALARLSDATGEALYRELGAWMVAQRGTRPSPFEEEVRGARRAEVGDTPDRVEVEGTYDGSYFQDDTPLLHQREPVGHAVRAMYLYCGALDCFGTTGYAAALEQIWDRLVSSRLYVTGGIGSSAKNEGFTEDFDLPNEGAYAETCAAIGLVMWASRMSRATGSSRYADVMERTLYNAVLSGVSMDATEYFYTNPLASRGGHLRQPWYDCACCPPNLARLLLSLERYAVSVKGDEVTIDLPIAMSLDHEVGGVPVRIEVQSEYPWDGKVTLTVTSDAPVRMAIRVRKPEFSVRWSAEGPEGTDLRIEDGYLVAEGEWRTGDRFEIDLDMPTVWLKSDPRNLDAVGRTALMRGPVLYCLEQADLGFPTPLFAVDPGHEVVVERHEDPRKARTLRVFGYQESPEWGGRALYEAHTGGLLLPTSVPFVPYATWANREPGWMEVWVRSALG